MNPIIVNEYRQAVRSKAVSTVLLLLLLALCVTSIFILMAYNTGETGSYKVLSAGKDTFNGMFVALVIAGMMCIPQYMGIRLAIECAEDNPDLYFFTAISPHAVVRGKAMSAAGTTLLLFCVCLPFISLAQALRGVDLVAVLFALVMAYACILLAAMAAMTLAALHVTRPFKILLGLAFLVCMVPCIVMVVAEGIDLVERGCGMMDKEFWQNVGASTCAYAAIFGLLYSIATAMLMPASANRALLLRGYIAAAWVVSGAACTAVALVTRDADTLTGWGIAATMIIAVSSAFVCVEGAQLGRRARQWLPKRLAFRLAAALFCNGPATGLLWTAVMAGLTVAVCVVAGMAPGWNSAARLQIARETAGMAALYLYVAGAVLTANAGVMFFARRAGRLMILPVAVTLLAVLLAAPNVAVLTNSDPHAKLELPWRVLSIMTLLDDMSNPSKRHVINHVIAGIIFVGAGLAVNIPWFLRQLRQYKPTEPAA